MTAEPRTPEQTARAFHEAYERLAPQHGYETRKESAVPWEDVPANNKALMTAVCGEVVGPLVAELADLRAELAERTAALERTNDSYIAAEREIERLQTELAASTHAYEVLDGVREQLARTMDERENTRLRAELAASRKELGRMYEGINVDESWRMMRAVLAEIAVPVVLAGDMDDESCRFTMRTVLDHHSRIAAAALAAAPTSPAEAPTSDQTCDRCGETNETVDYRFDAPAGTPVALCVPCAPLWRPPAKAPQAEPASEERGFHVDPCACGHDHTTGRSGSCGTFTCLCKTWRSGATT